MRDYPARVYRGQRHRGHINVQRMIPGENQPLAPTSLLI